VSVEGVVDRIIGWPGRARSSTQLLVLSLFLIEIVAALARPAGLAPRVVAATCGLLLIVAVAALLRRLRFDAGTILVVLGGVWLYLGYLGYTAYTERNYDAGAQLEYIEFIVKNHRLPKADGCFVCHHPPLYYVLGAFAYAIFQRVRLIPPADGLQLYSLVLCIGFIVFGALLSRELAKDRREVQLATALVVFWPYGVHNSVRVHNDSLVSTLLVASLWLTVRFARRDRPRDLYLAGFVGALAILTKTSAIVIVVVLALLLAHRLFRAPDKLRTLGRGLLVGGMLAAALFLNAVRKDAPLEREPAPRGALCEKLLGSACHIGEHQFVGNKAKNYLWFDLKSFVEEPYFIAERDVAGRQYFWNDLLKSSLFGTHNTVPDRETSYELNKYMAMGMNWLLLGMTGYLGAGLVAMRKEERRRFALIGLFVVLSIVFLAGFKILVPAPHHNDFRHVFPVVVPMAIVYAASVARFRRSSALLSGLGLALAGAFVALSIAYFVPKYDWAMRVTARTIPHDLAEFSAIVPEGTPWDKDTNLFIDGNHTIELRSKTPLTVRQLDLSVDNNDTYEITIVGATETRVLSVGPRPMKGLARYFVPVNPPVEGVSVLRLRPTGGDRAYSMGHFVVR
jgi:4-amino-4-deoxy-L-arabinose transferase-like glycosyltransferase